MVVDGCCVIEKCGAEELNRLSILVSIIDITR